ncbi:MAG TPA: AMP-binding protein, partial [Mycobacterium sp.]|nr:AMP-binding protein [Mycobacterium sp.]
MIQLARLPDARAESDPDAPAVADEDNGQLSNAEFLNRVQNAAGRLWEAGVRPGDVVAIKLPNRIELVIALFAAWRLGAAATPINPGLTETEVGYQLADSGAGVMVSLDAAAGVVVVEP